MIPDNPLSQLLSQFPESLRGSAGQLDSRSCVADACAWAGGRPALRHSRLLPRVGSTWSSVRIEQTDQYRRSWRRGPGSRARAALRRTQVFLGYTRFFAGMYVTVETI